MWGARVCACALLVCVLAVDIDKRAEIAPAPFVMGSRYGRGAPPAPALRVMAPRNDRFFMGSRYGKRSPSAELFGSEAPLVCSYTGLAPLYRCLPRAHPGPLHRTHAGPPLRAHPALHPPLYAAPRKSGGEPFLVDLDVD